MTIYIDFWDVVLIAIILVILISCAVLEFRDDRRKKRRVSKYDRD